MIPELYQHQKNIIAEDKLKCGLFLGTGSSKTRTALEMAEGSVLVICPKQQKLDELWLRENKKWDTNKDITVISKETFRRDWETLPYFTTVICDEVHTMLGISPETRMRKGIQIPKTSQLFESFYNFLQKNPPKRLYLLSATPVSKPFNLFALGVLFGVW